MNRSIYILSLSLFFFFFFFFSFLHHVFLKIEDSLLFRKEESKFFTNNNVGSILGRN